MDRVKITDDLEFSQIVYGMWRVADDTDTSPAHVEAKVQTALDQGITTFDQADIYGGYVAEAVLGGALKANPKLRDQMEIVTKCDIVVDAGRHAGARVKHYDTSKAHIDASVEASLTDMGIDHIDLLLIHRPDPFMDHQETGAALDAQVASGKVRSVGVSNFKLWDWNLLQSAMKTPLVTNQIEISLAEISPLMVETAWQPNSFLTALIHGFCATRSGDLPRALRLSLRIQKMARLASQPTASRRCH